MSQPVSESSADMQRLNFEIERESHLTNDVEGMTLDVIMLDGITNDSPTHFLLSLGETKSSKSIEEERSKKSRSILLSAAARVRRTRLPEFHFLHHSQILIS